MIGEICDVISVRVKNPNIEFYHMLNSIPPDQLMHVMLIVVDCVKIHFILNGDKMMFNFIFTIQLCRISILVHWGTQAKLSIGLPMLSLFSDARMTASALSNPREVKDKIVRNLNFNDQRVNPLTMQCQPVAIMY